jgi:hypothetical protein
MTGLSVRRADSGHDDVLLGSPVTLVRRSRNSHSVMSNGPLLRLPAKTLDPPAACWPECAWSTSPPTWPARWRVREAGPGVDGLPPHQARRGQRRHRADRPRRGGADGHCLSPFDVV